jgi:hypothetical protein
MAHLAVDVMVNSPAEQYFWTFNAFLTLLATSPTKPTHKNNGFLRSEEELATGRMIEDYRSDTDDDDIVGLGSTGDSIRSLQVTSTGSRNYDRYDTISDDFNSEQFCCDSSRCEYLWDGEEINSSLNFDNLGSSRLELDDRIEDIGGIIRAIESNKTVRDVEVHIEALEGLTSGEQRGLANALCGLSELRSLLVYKNSILFAEPLVRNSPIQLETLRLCKLNITESGNVELLVSALGSLPCLKTLDIGLDTTNGSEVLATLSRMAPVFVGLECFRVDYKWEGQDDCNLDDRIVVAIAQAVEHSETLKTLSLPPFSCTENCYKALIHLVQKNRVIHRIEYWIRVCSLHYPDANEAIDHLLHLNRSGVRKLLQQDNITNHDIHALLSSHGDDLHTLYHLFSTNPSLLLASI